MKKTATDSKKSTETQLLDLLQKVLPKATSDPRLAAKIMEAVEHELTLKNRTSAFDKFCRRCELPNLEPESVEEVRKHLTETFKGGDVTIKPNKKEQFLAVEVALPDGAQFIGDIPVRDAAKAAEEEQEVKLKFIPFPVSLPGDKELVWVLAKRENMSNDEAGIALNKLEDDFWASKSGQKMMREGVERCFPEFIARVPAALLNEVSLKRHYKLPEPLKVLRGKGAQS